MPQYIDYQQLKADLAFPVVLSHYNIGNDVSRDQDMISCPFHNDDKPSCSINKKKGMFRCFGCAEQGNVLKFICLMEDLDDDNPSELRKAGLIAIESILGRTINDYAKGKGGKKNQAKPGSSKKSEGNSKSADSADACNRTNKNDPEPENLKINEPLSFELQNLDREHSFFSDRGCDREAVETFGLGMCGKGMMAGRAVFPVHNAKGELVAYCGRWPDDNPPEGEGKYKLPKGFNKRVELFNQHRAKAMLEQAAEDPEAEILPLVIVEGYWSAIRLHMAGIPAVATFGSDVSEAQAQAIAQLTSDTVIVYDGDEAGLTGTERAVFALAKHTFVRAIMLEDGMKPDKVDLDIIRNAW